MEELKEYIVNNKIKVILLIIAVIFIIVLIAINKNKDDNKVYDNKNYIYTKEIKNIQGIKSKLPYINIYSEEIEKINKDIMTKYYTENIIGEKYMDYEYYKRKNVISLIVKIYYLESNDFIPDSIDFYNIDTNTGMLLSNEELLSIYNISELEVENKLLEYIEKYYNYEKKEEYISNCDLNCYKRRLGSNVLEDINYYIKDSSLYAYKYFLVDKDFAYDENKPFELFRFKIS